MRAMAKGAMAKGQTADLMEVVLGAVVERVAEATAVDKLGEVVKVGVMVAWEAAASEAKAAVAKVAAELAVVVTEAAERVVAVTVVAATAEEGMAPEV